jgi:UDP-glucose 4-epimerase
VGAKTFPLPSPIAAGVLRARGFPAYLVNFYKYPCVIGDDAFRRTYGWSPRVGTKETLLDTVRDARRKEAS